MRTFASLLAACLVVPAWAQDEAPASETTPEAEDLKAAVEEARVAAEAARAAAEDAQTAMQALAARMDGVEEVLAGQRRKTTALDLRLLGVENPDLVFDLEGEYRTRGYVFPNLFDGQERDARYMDHWLRLRPTFDYKGLAKLNIEFRGLQNVVWGDNASLASTSLFAGNPSNTLPDGTEGPNFELNRAWVEFSVPVGLVRVGRQPSSWGLGALVNSGDGFDDTFGENKNSTTFDRVMFATKPIAIAQTIAGKEPADIPLFLALGVDRLVEDPLIQYYGYVCEPGIAQGDDDYDPRCDSDGNGLTDLTHDFADDTRTPESRRGSWWADQDDDVVELIYALIYRGEDVDYLGGHGDLTVGGYLIHRYQNETDSQVLIPDFYMEASWNSWYLGFEGVGIFGRTRAITLPGAYDPSVFDADPLAKTASISGYVSRVGYRRPDFSAILEHGFASGDDNVADERFTGRPLNRDLNVGLLLYEEVIARVTSELWTDSARGLWSNGGVYNSRYFFPLVRYSPLDNWDLQGAFLVAMPHRPDGRFIKCAEGDNVECSQTDATSPILGWEADFAIKHRFHEHLLFSLETGYAHATDRLPLQSAGLNPNGNFFTLQSRLAWEF